MGANQSSEAPREQVISAPEQGTSVEFSPTLINRLSSPSSSTSSSSSSSPKQSSTSTSNSTDEIVRRRLATESAHLRTQEAEILQAISAALEKENLDKEKPGMSSEVLGRDIEEVREKIERIKRDRMGDVGKGVEGAKEGVRKCYSKNPDRPLDCWKEVQLFKSEVAKVEQSFLKSLE